MGGRGGAWRGGAWRWLVGVSRWVTLSHEKGSVTAAVAVAVAVAVSIWKQ